MSEESSSPESATPPEQPTTPPVQQPTAPDPAAYTKDQKDKKIIAGILAILLGGLGIHKFVLGYTVEGVIMLAVSIVGMFVMCGIPLAPVAMGVIGLIEGILYLTKTDDEFVATYVVGRKG
ncbi:MAG: TM2 domain-containing protein, partial [Akkermansiaceae bacterium]